MNEYIDLRNCQKPYTVQEKKTVFAQPGLILGKRVRVASYFFSIYLKKFLLPGGK